MPAINVPCNGRVRASGEGVRYVKSQALTSIFLCFLEKNNRIQKTHVLSSGLRRPLWPLFRDKIFITLSSSRSATSYLSPCRYRPGSRKGRLNLPTLRSALFPIPVIRSTDLSSACYQQTAGHPGAAHLYHRSWMDGRSLKTTCQTDNMQDALNGPSSSYEDSTPCCQSSNSPFTFPPCA